MQWLSAYDRLYRWGLTPWERAARTQSMTIERLLDREERTHPALGVALDLGCGTGAHTVTLARRGWQAWGVDTSVEAITRARARAFREGVAARFDQADVRRLDAVADPPGPVSLVVDVGCYHGIPPTDRPAVADGVTRLAGPGCTMVLVAMDRRPTRLFPVGATAEELGAVFAGWGVEKGERLDLSGVPGIVGRLPFRVFRLSRNPR